MEEEKLTPHSSVQFAVLSSCLPRLSIVPRALENGRASMSDLGNGFGVTLTVRKGQASPELSLDMHPPCRPPQLNWTAPKSTLGLVVHIKYEVDEHVGVVGPAHAKNDTGVITGPPQCERLKYTGYQNCESEGEVGCRLGLYGLQLVVRDFGVPYCPSRWYETQEVLSVYSDPDTDSRNVGVGRYEAGTGHRSRFLEE